MHCDSKDDSLIIKAIQAQNNGMLIEAANLFQRAGNQYRNPADKEELWKAAKRARWLNSQD